MRGSLFSRGVGPGLTWFGLVWVYSGGFWLLGMLGAASGGWPEGAVAAGVRLVGTLALGIGLCATERWAWASVVCLTSLYALLGLLLAAMAGWTLLTLPGNTLSWAPVFYGLNADRAYALFRGALGVGLVAGGAARMLWEAQTHFEIPKRRAYTALVQHGLAGALPLFAADGFLLLAWWARASG